MSKNDGRSGDFIVLQASIWRAYGHDALDQLVRAAAYLAVEHDQIARRAFFPRCYSGHQFVAGMDAAREMQVLRHDQRTRPGQFAVQQPGEERFGPHRFDLQSVSGRRFPVRNLERVNIAAY